MFPQIWHTNAEIWQKWLSHFCLKHSVLRVVSVVVVHKLFSKHSEQSMCRANSAKREYGCCNIFVHFLNAHIQSSLISGLESPLRLSKASLDLLTDFYVTALVHSSGLHCLCSAPSKCANLRVIPRYGEDKPYHPQALASRPWHLKNNLWWEISKRDSFYSGSSFFWHSHCHARSPKSCWDVETWHESPSWNGSMDMDNPLDHLAFKAAWTFLLSFQKSFFSL